MNDEAAVERANAEFYTAIETSDLARMRNVWMDDDSASCVHPGWRVLHGTSRIMRSWAVIFANTPYIQFFLTDVEVSVWADVASVTCTENVLTGDETTGPDAFGGAKAVATNVFVRTTDGWRLWIHHASPVLSADHHDDE